ncbi:hypothetical protein LF817_05080 [Halobacillus sp. A1]|uniref:sporulation protein YpjB n=1 Tax=Halobacillus sp. A1 TaxID=2880262 RepID=UPI0020A65358|nr:sporulation protein YpjB [Halobacillus sp. A1]MCP3030709.1 hypothetical protein [Halobacillus sp. A1]
MGRAIVVIFLLLSGLFFISNSWIFASEKNDTLDPFISQYEYLLQDQKVELATKMLNNRYSELESYFEGESEAQLETLNRLVQNTIEDPYHHADTFILFVEAGVDPEPEKYLLSKVDELKVLVENAETSPSLVTEKWANLEPAMSHYFKGESVNSITSTMDLYVNNPTAGTQQSLVRDLDHLILEEDESLTYDAFIWTAIIIGSTILLTLVYVGYRKYRAEKEETQVKQKLNS